MKGKSKVSEKESLFGGIKFDDGLPVMFALADVFIIYETKEINAEDGETLKCVNVYLKNNFKAEIKLRNSFAEVVAAWKYSRRIG